MQMNNLFAGIITASLAVLAIAGCSSAEQGGEDFAGEEASAKFVNSPNGALEGSLLIKLSEGSTISDLDRTLEEWGASAERVFQPRAGHEAEEAKFGLDRWYQLRFSQDSRLTEIAEAFAGCKAVKAVEFDHIFKTDEPESETRGFAPYYNSIAGTSAVTATGSAPFNDPYFSRQWNLSNNGKFNAKSVAGADVDVVDAWRLTGGDPSIIVAIVDDGVMYDHPDLAANMWTNTAEANGKEGVDDDGNGFVDDIHGYNFYDDTGKIDYLAQSGSGHGTHVAGLVGAVNNNGIGISSVAGGTGKGDGVRLMSCQILNGGTDHGAATWARAFKYAADNGASVLQCSIGGNSGDVVNDAQFERGLYKVELEALEYFMEGKPNSGVITDGNMVIFSAGNNGKPLASYPGAYHKLICVASFSADYLPAWYTNYGAGVNICAPGGDQNIDGGILSTMPKTYSNTGFDYGYIQGTSQATPQVSGIVALGLSYAKKLGLTFTREEFKSMVLSSVNDVDSRLSGTKVSGSHTLQLSSYKGNMGTGSIDAWKLLMAIEGTPMAMVKSGEEAAIPLKDWFGGGASGLTYIEATLEAADAAALGADSATISDGVLHITCSKLGAGKIRVKAIAGGTVLGGGEVTGGMEETRTISIVSRPFHSSWSGGWL
jgi:serine protease